MNRYSRLLQLPDFNEKTLEILGKMRILVVGAGGVGQHVSTYLITNGITSITIVDFDKVELSNLNRQILLEEKDVGRLKIDVVREALLARNSEADIKGINVKIDETNVSKIVNREYDVVIDALDNWKSKFVISRECKKQEIPLLHIGVDGFRGQYCLFKKTALHEILDKEILDAPKDGVIGSVVGLISSMATTYLIQYLINKNATDELYYCDINDQRFNKIKLEK